MPVPGLVLRLECIVIRIFFEDRVCERSPLREWPPCLNSTRTWSRVIDAEVLVQMRGLIARVRHVKRHRLGNLALNGKTPLAHIRAAELNSSRIDVRSCAGQCDESKCTSLPACVRRHIWLTQEVVGPSSRRSCRRTIVEDGGSGYEWYGGHRVVDGICIREGVENPEAATNY